MFLNRNKIVILSHKNIIEKSDRLNVTVGFNFINVQDRDTIFERSGFNSEGKIRYKIVEYLNSAKNVVNKIINLK